MPHVVAELVLIIPFKILKMAQTQISHQQLRQRVIKSIVKKLQVQLILLPLSLFLILKMTLFLQFLYRSQVDT